jgi:hypothetical protein
LFLVLSIDSLLAYQVHGQRKHAVLLGVYAFLGFAAKMTMVVYLLPFGICLLVFRQWKLISIALLSFMVSLAFFYGLLMLGNYDLTYIKKNIIDSVNNGYNLAMAIEKVYAYFFARLAIFTIAVILLCVGIFDKWKEEKGDFILMFLLLSTFCTLSISFLMCLKAGSAENYFSEPILFLILTAGYILEKHHNSYRQLSIIALMIFGIALFGGHTIRYKYLLNKYPHPGTFFRQDKSEKAIEVNEIKRYLTAHAGSSYFYSENREVAMSFPFQCVMFPGDTHEYTYKRRVYDYSFFQRWISDRQCQYLVLFPYTESVYGIRVSELYVLKEKFPSYHLYELASPND